MKKLYILIIVIFFISCKSTFVTNDNSNINTSVNLYAFIGEKISVTEFNPNIKNKRIEIDSITGDTIRYVSFVMDLGFNNKYKVLKNVFNKIEGDTINFVAYNHYGRPGFENYKHVILYLSKDKKSGAFYHQKYQFDPVKKSKNGIWKGLKGQSIQKLFNKKKEGVLGARGIFD